MLSPFCAFLSSSSSSSLGDTTTTKNENYYRKRFQLGRSENCPPLFVAPMEGLGDKRFRKAISTVGGNFYDDICKEFTRVPGNLPNGAKAEKFIKKLSLHDYDAFELGSEE